MVVGLSSSLVGERIFSEIPEFRHNSIHNPTKTPSDMEAATTSASALRAQIAATEQELGKLKEQLAKIEEKETSTNEVEKPVTSKWPLSQEEYTRYGRQMIVPSIGIQGMFIASIAVLL